MKKRTVGIVVAVILCVIIVLFFILQANSLDLALAGAGIDMNSTIRNVEELDVILDKEFKVIQGTTKDGQVALIQLEKNCLGFWTVKDLSTPKDSVWQCRWAETVWTKHAGTQRYNATDIPEFYDEVHHVYCGNDALKWIDIPAEDLPDNLTVNIQQIGSFYLIHMISFKAGATNFDIIQYLTENGYIPN